MPKKAITVFIFGNYTPNSLRFSLPLSLARLLFVILCLMAVVVFTAFGLVTSGAYRFYRLQYLSRRNRQLEEEFKKVRLLKERLEFLEGEREKLSKMLGVELTPPPVDWRGAVTDSFEIPEWVKNQPWGKYSVPVLVPVSGYVVSRGVDSAHIAVDLAAAKESPVRAAADGVVTARGTDPQFGRFLLISHSSGYETYYGHLSSWLVKEGDTVQVGEVIARVGMTGKASAPHLHFEIRKLGKPIDPATLLKL